MTNIIEFITTGMGDGGAETLVKDYTLLLDKSKYHVTIVTIGKPDLTSANYKRLEEAGIEMISIYDGHRPMRTWLGKKIWNRFFHKRFVGKKLLKVVRRQNVQVIHCHLEVLFAVAAIAKKLKDVKIFFTCHSQPKVIFKPSRWSTEEVSARYLIKHNCFQMIALHDEMRRELNDRFGVNNTVVIHNGIDFHKFLSVDESKESIRKSLDVPLDTFVVGHIGRFTEPKNHQYLVDIFAEILKMKPNAHLLMVGAGTLQSMTEAKLITLGLEGKYTILSHRTDIPRLLRAMDIFVFPSIYEGLPVSVVEAQVAGLRVIASDVITSECFFGENAVPLSIADSPVIWAQTVLDNNVKGPYSNDIYSFDLNKEIIRLGQLYEQ